MSRTPETVNHTSSPVSVGSFALLCTCFVLSGIAALVYQTAWTRQFAIVFGTSELAVATVLAMEPEILVLDEPSSNLDPASRRELADIIRSLDVTVLMVTHDLPYALELCPRSVVLSDGHVVADGATYDVLTDDDLMRSHRLELPFGFDPRTTDRGTVGRFDG